MKKSILVIALLIAHCTFQIEHCKAQVWSSLGSGMNGSIYSLVVFNNELIAGGNFTVAGGVSANRIAKWNGTVWSPIGSGMNGAVYALDVFNNELIAGGNFTTAGGISANYIAKWNGTNWAPLGSGMSHGGITTGVFALVIFNNELIAGGSYDTAGGVGATNIAKWNGANWMPLGNGLYHQAVLPIDGVRALNIFNNELIAGGAFNVAGTGYAYSVAKWNGTSWSPLGSGVGGGLTAPIWVNGLTLYNNELICGGDFWSAGGTASYFIGKWNGTAWSGLGIGIGSHYNTSNRVINLTVFNNELIVGGIFDTAGVVYAQNIAKWNGTSWTPFGGGANGGVYTFIVSNNALIVGGNFTIVGGTNANSVAKWGPAFSVSGQVRYSDNNQPATGGYVKAIKFDKVTGNIITFDSVQIQPNGNYVLTNVPQDSIDIGVYPNSTTQNDWVMTYYPSTIYWQNATTLYPTGNLTNINVGAIRLTSSTNNNSVNGKVMRLNDNPSLANLKDAVLYAKNGSTFVRCGVSDINGVYHLPYLPAGSLKIIVNRLGFTGDSTTVTVTATNNLDSVNFYLYKLPVGIKQIGNTIPTEYKLYQNYPNPFNPATIIKFSVPKNVKSETSKLVVYDLLGKEIATLVNGSYKPGVYEVSFDGSTLPSGIYFYKLMSGDFSEVKKMLLIK